MRTFVITFTVLQVLGIVVDLCRMRYRDVGAGDVLAILLDIGVLLWGVTVLAMN